MNLLYVLICQIQVNHLLRVFYFLLFTNEKMPDLLPITSVILFILTVMIIMVGVIGEYISMIFTESKNRPIYLIDKIYDKFKEKD